MSRPILSRPRTRVYGCNYDKGESYYKPMVDHLDRKYSGRPLFPEPRTSFADEVAARRSDIGSRDLSGPRTFARDLDLEYESPRTRTQAPNSLHGGGGLHHGDDEDTVYDIRGQRTNRRNMTENFGSEVAASTRCFKAQAASISYDAEHYTDLRRSVQQERRHQDVEEKFTECARSAMEDSDAAFKRRSKLKTESEGERNSAMTRWAKLPNLEPEINTTAATRARQTKARLEDLESEMEEIAERQAKRERRAAALRALVNDNSSTENFVMEQNSKKVSIKSCEKADNYIHGAILGSRHLTGTRDETFEDDLDFLYDGCGGVNPEDNIDEEFVSMQRRFKQRAADAFEEDLAELRRKRRDLQDRLFDMVDVGAEISKAKTTLENAKMAFLKHATKFDNNEKPEVEPENLVARLEKTRKVKKMANKNDQVQDASDETAKSKQVPLLKWSKFAELENEMPKLVGDMTKARIRNEVEVIPEMGMMTAQSDINKQKQSSERRRSKKRSVVKRKKTVTF